MSRLAIALPEPDFAEGYQQLQADRARYLYESALVRQARLSLLNCPSISDEQQRVVGEWLDYADVMQNPDPATDEAMPF